MVRYLSTAFLCGYADLREPLHKFATFDAGRRAGRTLGQALGEQRLPTGVRQYLASIQGRMTGLLVIIVAAAVAGTAGLDIARHAEHLREDVSERQLLDAQMMASITTSRLKNGFYVEFRSDLVQVLRQRPYLHFNLIDLKHNKTYFGMTGVASGTVDYSDPAIAGAVDSPEPTRLEQGDNERLIYPILIDGKTVALIDILGGRRMPVAKLLELLGVAGLIVVFLVAFFVPVGILMAHSLVRPMRAITRAARRVREGDLDVPPLSAGHGEVGELTATFNEMVAHLRQDTNEIRRLAFTDVVTGLANRERFRSLLDAALREHTARQVSRALFFIDLDNFKQVNDIYGHTQGDIVLSMISQRFREVCVAQGFVPRDPTERWQNLPAEARLASLARHAGDEFTILVRGHQGAQELAALAEALCAVARMTLDMEGASVAISASVGLVDFAMAPGVSTSDFMRFADLAMYEAKRSGRDRYVAFTPELDQRSRDRILLEMELRRAVAAQEFRVYYMPQVSLGGGDCRAAEALVRWQHPRRGLLAPAAFLDVAEETGLLAQIDRQVLDETCRQIAAWARQGVSITVAVNVSPSEFHRADFVEGVLSALERHGVAPNCLELELTESIAMTNPARVAAIVTQLRAVGIRFALDDFGTGFSNLGNLTTLPLDTIKIDRSFVAGLNQSERTDAEVIVETILSLARKLGVSTVAEGVETPGQAHWLRHNGCSIGQGYYFGKPMKAEEFGEKIVDPALRVRLPPPRRRTSPAA